MIAAISFDIRATRDPSCWRPRQINSGVGTSRSLRVRQKWNHYHLYVVLDVYSRYVVGWMVADRESATLAKKLIAEICKREQSSQASSPSTPTAARRCARSASR